jgi:hypothetical protein
MEDTTESDAKNPLQRITGFFSAHWPLVAIAIGWAIFIGAMFEPVTKSESHQGRLVVSIVGIVLTLSYAWAYLRERKGLSVPFTKPMQRFLAVLAIIYGAFNYYHFDRDFAEGFHDYTDITYYYINSKYFDELGYTSLYEAMLLADLDGPKRFAPQIRTIRNLEDYEEEPARKALREGPDVRDDFTPERWEAFKHDVDWFMSRRVEQYGVRGLQKNFFVDHGYNPPPTWTMLGGALSKAVPVEYVKAIASVDLVLIVLMFIAIGWAFGPDVALLCALWYVATFSSRWPILTHSLLRFDWVVALTLGIVALKVKRPALGGALMMWAALSRVFPFIFGVPIVVKLAWDAYKTRTISRTTWRFAAGAGGMFVVGLSLAWADVGTQGFKDGVETLLMHNGAEAYSSQKVGLGDAVFFRGEVNRKQMRNQPCGAFERMIGSDCETHGNIYGKSKLLKLIEWPLRVVGIAAMLLVLGYAIRSKRPLHHLPALAVFPLFCLTNPSYYYYILRVVLALFHAEDLSKRSNSVGLSWLFGMEVVAHITKLNGYERYTTTATTSWMFIGYFLIVGILMFIEMRDDESEDEPVDAEPEALPQAPLNA